MKCNTFNSLIRVTWNLKWKENTMSEHGISQRDSFPFQDTSKWNYHHSHPARMKLDAFILEIYIIWHAVWPKMELFSRYLCLRSFIFPYLTLIGYVKTKKLFYFRLMMALVYFWMMRTCWESLFNSLIKGIVMLFLHSFTTINNLSLIL